MTAFHESVFIELLFSDYERFEKKNALIVRLLGPFTLLFTWSKTDDKKGLILV